MKEQWTPKNPDYQQRVKDSFNRQQAMKTMGIELIKVYAGEVQLYLPYRPEHTQQHGFMHAGVITTAMDSACGYAAFSLMPADASVLSVEFKTNLLAPAKGDGFEIIGHVIKPGRTITVSEGQAFAVSGHSRKLVATMSCTLMAVYNPELDTQKDQSPPDNRRSGRIETT